MSAPDESRSEESPVPRSALDELSALSWQIGDLRGKLEKLDERVDACLDSLRTDAVRKEWHAVGETMFHVKEIPSYIATLKTGNWNQKLEAALGLKLAWNLVRHHLGAISEHKRKEFVERAAEADAALAEFFALNKVGDVEK